MFSVLRRVQFSPSSATRRALSADAFIFKGVSTSDIVNSSFRIKEGSKVSLMGPNEAAKSDVLDLLNGVVKASSGVVSLSPSHNVIRFQPTIPKEKHILSVKKYLEQSLSTAEGFDSSAIIQQVLEDVKLGTRTERRTINTLSVSQHARLQLAAALLKSPDVLLLDQPTVTNSGSLSYDDVQDLTDFLSNFPKTCVVNSSDEDFLNSFTDTVLNIEPNGSIEKMEGTYTAAKKIVELRARAKLSSAMEDKFRAKPAQKSDNSYARFAEAEAELDALNAIGFVNSKTSDEEHVRLMMILMILHPPLVYALYHAGVFDAIL